jgi:2-C-methyl-D-erythritol 4-phosphate cytidylyltransferase/2-C-methyl-D-erythritol 2,4-cyclodiphosphate synthase
MQEVRVGIGYDVHKFADSEQKVLIPICGVMLEHDKQILAHSDGDVGIHAVVDAILGAIAVGDIGQHFPPTDPKWKDKDSSHFLLYANELLKQKNGSLVNIDVVIICERPKVGPHREKMRERLAEILDIDVERVSVKATTTEKMGYLGRKEGIAAQAVVSCVLKT